MKKQGKGKIINLSSETVFSPTKTMIHYVASKAAIIGITRVLAGELGQYGICVNAVAPGFTDTEASRTVDSIEKFDISMLVVRRSWSMAEGGCTKKCWTSNRCGFIIDNALL